MATLDSPRLDSLLFDLDFVRLIADSLPSVLSRAKNELGRTWSDEVRQMHHLAFAMYGLVDNALGSGELPDPEEEPDIRPGLLWKLRDAQRRGATQLSDLSQPLLHELRPLLHSCHAIISLTRSMPHLVPESFITANLNGDETRVHWISTAIAGRLQKTHLTAINAILFAREIAPAPAAPNGPSAANAA